MVPNLGVMLRLESETQTFFLHARLHVIHTRKRWPAIRLRAFSCSEIQVRRCEFSAARPNVTLRLCQALGRLHLCTGSAMTSR